MGHLILVSSVPRSLSLIRTRVVIPKMSGPTDSITITTHGLDGRLLWL